MSAAMPRNHLIERAAVLLRGGLGLGVGPASPAAAAQPGPVAPAPAPAPVGTPLPGRVALDGGVVLDLQALQRAGLVDGGGKRTRVAEEFNIGAGNVLRAVRAAQKSAGGAVAQGGGLPNLLMVTSAKPDEGKSFSSLNLAASLARNGLARVILADIDPKLGSLTTALGLDGLPGLLDLAAQTAPAGQAGQSALRPEAVLVATAIRDLSVIPLGTREPGRSDRGIASQLLVAIERIGRRFGGSLVVLDAPPCLATSEPAALAPLAGVVVVVVEAERTQREELEQALEMLKPCPNVLLLLNKVRGTSGPHFGDYDYYGA